MIMETAVQVSNEYRNLPVTQLQESTSNPRKRFDTKSLEELAASFKAQGVLQPLLVRAIEEDKYEVIAGARRLRAANLAALEEVPVRIVELSDAACVETQLVENIQRENVHPLEEAFAFYGLLHTNGLQYDINSLATRAGKSPAFVATRLRLVELTPSIAEAFLADEIGVGHALEIAKLPQAEQQRAFDAAFHTVWNGGKETRILRPVRDLTAWIEQNILLSLDCVPFDKDDEGLVPEAGSCANCPKRTGFNTLLFDAALQDSCTDKECYNNKLTKNVERQIAEKPKLVQITNEWKAPGNSAILGRNQYVALNLSASSAKSKKPLSPYQKPCKHMSEAIVIDGTERGRTAKVCAEPNCPVHFADRRTPNPAQTAKEREQRRQELKHQKLEATVRHRTLAEVLKRVGAPLDRADLTLVAGTLLKKLDPLRQELLARRHKLVEGTSSEVTHPQVQQAIARLLRQPEEGALSKLLIEVVLLECTDRTPTSDPDVLIATAKRHRVDVDKVRKAVEQEFTAKRAKQSAKQNKAAKKSTTKTAA
jgi:ParB family chromosome partitioning protein